MNELPTSHFSELQGQLRQLRKNYSIPTFEISPMMKRSDNPSIFKEGEIFSGLLTTKNAMACVTLVASSHTPPTVSTDQFLSIASDVFAINSSLPIDTDISILAPQVIVWWGKNDTSEIDSDFSKLYNLDSLNRQEFIRLISDETILAVKLIKKIKQSATIWGSWGNGSDNERVFTGRSRGGPTNKIGHTHVTHFDEARKISIPRLQQTDAKDAVNFYSPWVTLVMEKFGGDFSNFINQSVKNDTIDIPEFTIEQTNMDLSTSGHHDFHNGFEITFSSPAKYAKVVDMLISIGGKSEILYKDLLLLYEEFYKDLFMKKSTDETYNRGYLKLKSYGFSQRTAEKMLGFLFSIRPTNIQISNWIEQMSKYKNVDVNLLLNIANRYAHVSKRIRKNKSYNTTVNSLVYDTYRDKEEIENIKTTWPEHASYWYLINDYKLSGDEILVNTLKLFPLIGTSVTGPERILGGIIKRPLK